MPTTWRTFLKATMTVMALAILPSPAAHAQVKATIPSGSMTPAWDNGIQPISRDSYWNAVACGKQGGERPLCVFSDADLCKNDDFVIALFTPYKQVAYEVWQAVRKHQEPPTPSYADAQRTRVTVGVTPAKGSKNAITGVVIKRGDRTLKPAQSVDAAGGRFIFDPAAFAATEDLALELIGRARTISCDVDQAVLKALR
jgi:hypothetical protein